MSNVAKCPHCKKPLEYGPTPSQLKREADVAAAAARRNKREQENELRKWYAADFKLVFEAVTRTKLNQAKPGYSVSNVLFQAILNTHAARLQLIEKEIQDKLNQ